MLKMISPLLFILAYVSITSCHEYFGGHPPFHKEAILGFGPQFYKPIFPPHHFYSMFEPKQFPQGPFLGFKPNGMRPNFPQRPLRPFGLKPDQDLDPETFPMKPFGAKPQKPLRPFGSKPDFTLEDPEVDKQKPFGQRPLFTKPLGDGGSASEDPEGQKQKPFGQRPLFTKPLGDGPFNFPELIGGSASEDPEIHKQKPFGQRPLFPKPSGNFPGLIGSKPLLPRPILPIGGPKPVDTSMSSAEELFVSNPVNPNREPAAEEVTHGVPENSTPSVTESSSIIGILEGVTPEILGTVAPEVPNENVTPVIPPDLFVPSIRNTNVFPGTNQGNDTINTQPEVTLEAELDSSSSPEVAVGRSIPVHEPSQETESLT